MILFSAGFYASGASACVVADLQIGRLLAQGESSGPVVFVAAFAKVTLVGFYAELANFQGLS